MESQEVKEITSALSCPVPMSDYPKVLLAHGGGGSLSHKMIEELFLTQFHNEQLDELHDGATLEINGMRLAFSTDSFVVDPLFFPGGDIGMLSVNGTVNDLAMCGAAPLYLSAAFIIEEGFSMDELRRIVHSMSDAAAKAGVRLVTGDTKVVDKGKGDKIFINTSGIGMIQEGVDISPKNARPGDKILLSGRIAEHGIAIMSVREGLEFESEIQSDCAPLNTLVASMLRASNQIHVLRDPTRGGVASALNEIAESAKVGMMIHEERIPIGEAVKGACEILGFDPLYVANEGKLLAIVEASDSERILSAMRAHSLGRDSAIIGEVVSGNAGAVLMKSLVGGTRTVDMLSGEQLPRIC